MKILVVGGGGREHAIIRKLRESPAVGEILCAPGNGGIAADARCVPVKATDLPGMVRLAKEEAVDFVVIAPDDPLALGMADELAREEIPSFGPNKAAARIESSKVFAKDLMERYRIPTAAYRSFTKKDEALAWLKQRGKWPTVIKADGLALGKGVVIAGDLEEAEQALDSIMERRIFGDSGREVVVEEFLTGPEVSVMAFCDGKSLLPMVSSMDHKQVFDGGKGPNTGGMGTIAPNPHYDDDMAARCMEEIFLPTVRAMEAEGCPFRGCLYFGLMLTPSGPKVIEYNCRFGDPETQVVLPLLETDLLEIMRAVADGTLDRLEIRWRKGAAACVVLASGGYPGGYETGIPIEGLNASGQVTGAVVYHAGTVWDGTAYRTAGGRVLGVTAAGDSLDEALEQAYGAAEKIRFEGMHFRSDIGRC